MDRTKRESPHKIAGVIVSARWDEATETMKTEEGQEELKRQDVFGRLPLHRACYWGAPCDFVEAGLEEYRGAVNVTNKKGELTGVSFENHLHNLVVNVVMMVICEHDDLPLHVETKANAPLEVLTKLLDAHPEGAVAKNSMGELPIHIFAREGNAENEEHVETAKALIQPILSNEEACGTVDWYGDGETPMDIAARFNALSLLTCFKVRCCPRSVIMTIARRHPEQLLARDEDGNCALHLAAANPNFNGSLVAGTEVGEDFIGELVNLYPGVAAARNSDGRFPLCLAIESGKKWHEGVEAIADAAQHVVVTRDEATNLYPFMLAAAGDDSCLSTVFSLLRCCPELKRYVID